MQRIIHRRLPRSVAVLCRLAVCAKPPYPRPCRLPLPITRSRHRRQAATRACRITQPGGRSNHSI